MHVAAATQEPIGAKSHRSLGSGKIIRPGSCGHVEVTAIPEENSEDLKVKWEAVGGTIPEPQREAVLAATRKTLTGLVDQGELRCGVLLIIEYGSFHGKRSSAHAEAAELAVRDALRRSGFISSAAE